jgi:hypothetical protein
MNGQQITCRDDRYAAAVLRAAKELGVYARRSRYSPSRVILYGSTWGQGARVEALARKIVLRDGRSNETA